MRTNIKRTILMAGVAGMVFSFASTASAWTGPTSTPPLGNMSAPINTGATTQTKAGVLNVAGLLSVVDIIAGDNMYADAFFYNSDRRLKREIKPLNGSLAKILKLEGVSFAWKEGGDKNIGLIAQDVEDVYPELVLTNPSTGLKSVEYGNLIAPLIEAVKEQQKEIELLKAEIAKLKASK